MSRKRTLALITITLLLSGCLFALIPFIAYLNPSAKAFADLPRFEIPDIEPNSFVFVEYPLSAYYSGGDILLVRRDSGERNYLYIPKHEGKHALPDYFWWRPGVICNELAPDFKRKEIYCRDPDAPSEYRWTLDGVALTDYGWVPDLNPIAGKEEHGDFIFFHPAGRQ